MEKSSFVIYKSFYEPLRDLTNEQMGRLFKALFEYQINKIENIDIDIKMAFSFFKNQFNLDDEKYEKRVEANRNNGLRGGRPKTELKQNNPLGNNKPNKPDKDNEKENVKDYDNGKENENEDVCNNICHFGMKFKTENCFNCMKNNICKNEESPEFKFEHPKQSFYEWLKEKNMKYEEYVEHMKINNKEPVELFDYNWLDDNEN